VAELDVGGLDVAGYLARLGVTNPGPPSIEALRVLHRAHVEQVPYENIEIQLGRPTTVDPRESADRIVRRHRGGYCFHLNGAFAALLAALGYDVRWHVGGVQGRGDPAPVGPIGNHLALTVHGLPTQECPDGVWFVDAGLGDGLYEPLPLRPGLFRQGPFEYAVTASDVIAGGWRFGHDRTGSFTGMDFGPTVAAPADFAVQHVRLSTSPESGFVRVCSAQRRDATGVDVLRGLVLSRVDGQDTAAERELSTRSEWYGVLADVFGLALGDLSGDERDALWDRVLQAHEAWAASRAAGG
jgi:arylamine N-acetyltransferase